MIFVPARHRFWSTEHHRDNGRCRGDGVLLLPGPVLQLSHLLGGQPGEPAQ